MQTNKPKIIDFKRSFASIDAYADVYNQGKERKQRIRGPERVMMKELAKIYTASITRRSAMHAIAGPQDMPSLRTNNVQLSKKMYCSTRTIQNYMRKLMAAGFITNKVGHGSNSSYEIWIDQNLLCWVKNPFTEVTTFKQDNTTVSEFYGSQAHLYVQPEGNDQDIAATANPSEQQAIDHLKMVLNDSHKATPSTSIVKQIFPHTNNLSSKKETINNIIIGPFLFKTTNFHTQLLKNKGIGLFFIDEKYTESPVKSYFYEQKNVPAPQKTDKTPANTAEVIDNKQISANNTIIKKQLLPVNNKQLPDNTMQKQRLQERLTERQMHYIRLFWATAIRDLYQGRTITPGAAAQGFEKILPYYANLPDDKLPAMHNQYMRRISHAKKYVLKDPDHRFIPLPHIYFNVANPHGFTGTKKWDAAWRNRKNTEALRKYNKILRKFDKNKTTNKVPGAEMIRRCEQQIGKMGNPVLVNNFLNHVINTAKA